MLLTMGRPPIEREGTDEHEDAVVVVQGRWWWRRREVEGLELRARPLVGGAGMGGTEDDDTHPSLLQIDGTATGHGGLGMEEASNQSNPIHPDSTGLAK
jgi:hypothetical protein